MALMERRSMWLFNDYPWPNNIAFGETAFYIFNKVVYCFVGTKMFYLLVHAIKVLNMKACRCFGHDPVHHA